MVAARRAVVRWKWTPLPTSTVIRGFKAYIDERTSAVVSFYGRFSQIAYPDRLYCVQRWTQSNAARTGFARAQSRVYSSC